MKLSQKGVLVTGASQGLGKEIAKTCVLEGADVLVCARSAAGLDHAWEELKELAAAGQTVLRQVADVSSPEAVRELVKIARLRLRGFCGVVNNAGVYGPKGLIEEISWDEWISALTINLAGTVLVCREVMPIFRDSGYGKIVNLSGGGATAPLPRLSAYATSKAAVVRFTETLAEEALGSGIDVNAVAPGALNTRLLEEILAAGPDKVGSDFYAKAVRQKANGGAPLERGADLCAYLLSAESDGITGRLISAIWDPWESLSSRKADLQGSEIYTLRRIVPKDRGQDWD